MRGTGKIYVVGCGPLTAGGLSYDAHRALEASDVIVGFKNYVSKIRKIFPDKEYVSNAMKQEVERVSRAVELARSGKTVSVVSSGDAGIYAMAGLVFEIAGDQRKTIDVQVVPGIPALAICAAALGAPLMNDFAVISFSNLLTPETVIEKRLGAYLESDAVIVIYNPVSAGRRQLFGRLWRMIEEKRAALWAGYVTNGGREDEEKGVHRVADMPVDRFDMHTLIIVGNEATDRIGGRMVTRRGYKMTASGEPGRKGD